MSPLPTTPIRVLLVDDSEDHLRLMQDLLEDTPYQVEIAKNGSVALERIRGGNYVLVLINVQMPVTGGLTATRMIRDCERQNGRVSIPIIALTADTLTQDPLKGIQAGCTAQLRMPLNRQNLLDALTRYQNGGPEAEAPKPAVVQMNAAIQALVPRYLDGRHKDIEALRSALARDDFAVIKRLGHNLKGTGSPYGFPVITEIGRSLECAGKENDKAEASRLITRLEEYMECVVSEYRK